MILKITAILVLATGCITVVTTDGITFGAKLDDKEITFYFNKTTYGDCLYSSQHNRVTCMKKQRYKDVVNEWKYHSSDIQYVSINCMQQKYYSTTRHICICVNGSDASNPGENKQNDDIHYCHLTSLTEGMFAKFSQLKALDLSDNAIRYVEENSFTGLNSLSYLDLSNNPLGSLYDGFLCDSPNLEILKLVNISLGNEDFDRVKLFHCRNELKKLIYIDLSNNNIENVPNELFESIPNVQTLVLRNNNIKFISESAFFGASNLRHLDISMNHLPALPRAFCDFLYQIKLVNLSTNHLTNFDMNHISNCETVEVFDISFNMIQIIKGTLLQRSDMKKFYASGNGLERISDHFLRNATYIEKIDLSFNKIDRLNSEVFSNLEKLKWLKLNANKFNNTSYFMNVFNNIRNLEILNLSSNNIGNIVNGTFQHLAGLESLDLSKNNISVMYVDTFKGLRSLKTLLLHHNIIRDVNKTSLVNLTSLETLDLSHNMLDNEIDNVTMPMSLTDVDLEENILSKFPKCFIGTNIKHLNLGSNIINDMTENRTTGLYYLEDLDLSFNQLNSFYNITFVNMTSLFDLNLSFNDISDTLDRDVLQGTQNLTVLNLEKNFIKGIDGFFSYPATKTITHLDLSYNTIEKIHYLISPDNANQSDHMLRELNLEHGYVHEISPDAFRGFVNLRQVNLENNLIETIRPFNIAYMTEFLFQHNQLECNCNMSWLSDSYVTVNGRQVSTFDYEVDNCKVRPEGIELPVRKVQKNQFRCQVDDGCDDMCDCFSYSDGNEINYVNCDGLIGNMPEKLSRDAKVIYLDGNRIPLLRLPKHYSPDFQTTELYLNNSQISIIEDIFFSEFELLKVLDLSKNKITTLPGVIFNNLLNLETLYLSDNNIKSISPSWFSGLSLKVLNLNGNKIEYVNHTVLSTLDSIHSLRYLQLHDNPWKCDCENRQFRIWLKSSGDNVQKRYDLKCYDSQRPLLALTVSEFSCSVAENHANRRGIITILIVVIVCLVLAASASFYYRRDILAVLYVKLGIGCLRHRYETNKPYDAYLVYDANDAKCSDWINVSLIRFLEKRRNPYKIVTTDRTKLLSSVANVEYTQLHESKCCLYVINNTVMSNSWCVESFHKAWTCARKDPKFKIIIIVFGDIELNLLEEEMRIMLSEGQYITARSRSVWDRLIYELPNPELGIESVQCEDDVSENDVIIYSATRNNTDEYGSVSIH